MCTSSSRTSLLLVFVPFDRLNANRRKKNMFINLVNCTSIHSFNIHSQCRRVHGKTTYEWHTDDIRVTYGWHTSTYKYIQVTYGWHTSTYEWHTSTYEWHTDGIRVRTSGMRVTYMYTRVTYRWHAVRKKNKLFKTFLIILFQNIRFVKEFLACNGCFGLFTKIKKGD